MEASEQKRTTQIMPIFGWTDTSAIKKPEEISTKGK